MKMWLQVNSPGSLTAPQAGLGLGAQKISFNTATAATLQVQPSPTYPMPSPRATASTFPKDSGTRGTSSMYLIFDKLYFGFMENSFFWGTLQRTSEGSDIQNTFDIDTSNMTKVHYYDLIRLQLFASPVAF